EGHRDHRARPGARLRPVREPRLQRLDHRPAPARGRPPAGRRQPRPRPAPAPPRPRAAGAGLHPAGPAAATPPRPGRAHGGRRGGPGRAPRPRTPPRGLTLLGAPPAAACLPLATLRAADEEADVSHHPDERDNPYEPVEPPEGRDAERPGDAPGTGDGTADLADRPADPGPPTYADDAELHPADAPGTGDGTADRPADP